MHGMTNRCIFQLSSCLDGLENASALPCHLLQRTTRICPRRMCLKMIRRTPMPRQTTPWTPSARVRRRRSRELVKILRQRRTITLKPSDAGIVLADFKESFKPARGVRLGSRVPMLFRSSEHMTSVPSRSLRHSSGSFARCSMLAMKAEDRISATEVVQSDWMVWWALLQLSKVEQECGRSESKATAEALG